MKSGGRYKQSHGDQNKGTQVWDTRRKGRWCARGLRIWEIFLQIEPTDKFIFRCSGQVGEERDRNILCAYDEQTIRLHSQKCTNIGLFVGCCLNKLLLITVWGGCLRFSVWRGAKISRKPLSSWISLSFSLSRTATTKDHLSDSQGKENEEEEEVEDGDDDDGNGDDVHGIVEWRNKIKKEINATIKIDPPKTEICAQKTTAKRIQARGWTHRARSVASTAPLVANLPTTATTTATSTNYGVRLKKKASHWLVVMTKCSTFSQNPKKCDQTSWLDANWICRSDFDCWKISLFANPLLSPKGWGLELKVNEMVL